MTISDFPDWLEGELSKRKMKPAELARLARKDQGIISRILRRERTPEPDTLTAIAKALKIPTVIVFRAAGVLPPEPNADEWVEEMDHKLSLLDPKYRSIAERIVDSMLAEEEAEARPKAKIRPRPAG